MDLEIRATFPAPLTPFRESLLMPSSKFVIAVTSYDQVGIISNVTGSVFRLGGNIDRISQTVMDGWFTILLTAVFPRTCDAEQIRSEIAGAGRDLGLDVSVRPYRQPANTRALAPSVYILTTTGRDRRGIFHEITGCLAAHGINILDLYCHLRDMGDFVLVGEVDVPDGTDLEQVGKDIAAVGRPEPLLVRIQHENLFQATNNLYLGHHHPLA